MANQWFRLYAEFATDPKVQMMSEADQRRFIMLLCLRCSNGCVTLHDEEIAFQLRISNEEWLRSKALFVSKGVLTDDSLPTAWDKRQFVSDSSAERVSRHRAKMKRPCNVTVTPPEAEAEAEAEKGVNQAAAADLPREHASSADAAAASPPVVSVPSENLGPPPNTDPTTARAIELTAMLRKRGAALQASNPIVRRWAESGVSDAQALSALETAEQRRQDKGSAQPINAGLIDAILSDGNRARAGPAQRPRQSQEDKNRMALAGWRPKELREATG
jgi:hypothetical protein